MPVRIHTFVLGPLETNAYALRDGGECWAVDPGMGSADLVRFLRREGTAPSRILLTHGHGDHIAGVPELRKAFPNVRVCCPAADAHMLADAEANLSGAFGFSFTVGRPDELISPGAAMALGESSWQVLDTSGHTPGGVSYYCAQAGAVLTGDSLFAGGIGRFDIPGADGQALLRNIRDKLLTLPPTTRVLPGHGPETTIGEELRNNPFLSGV